MPKRYKMLRNTKPKQRPFTPLKPREPRPEAFREINYPSRPASMDCTSRRDDRPATRATIAPAYNKGAYQVIPESDIEHIGK